MALGLEGALKAIASYCTLCSYPDTLQLAAWLQLHDAWQNANGEDGRLHGGSYYCQLLLPALLSFSWISYYWQSEGLLTQC